MRRPTEKRWAALFLYRFVKSSPFGRAVEQSETERVSPLSGNRICHLTFKRGFDHRSFFRRGLEILLVQLHADAVALPHDDRRACTGHADDGGSAQNAGLALDGGIPVLASTVTVLPLATLPAMVKLSSL